MDATTFSALSDPTRLRIMELLVDGSLTVGEIADRLHIRQPQASKHLRILLEAGLVEVQAAANRRYYKLRVEPLQAMDSWLETYRSLWSERFDKLDLYLQQLKERDRKPN
ncbi:DNA-binding transcriptional regulator, ArsR family [Paenibacillus algorifonticola]|uniref:DNA-binding transcriptional regulator, ArsR family n=1 Tax=Paenibacillus algorifonticola TaxID=684063 RepID=A0A1I2E6M7_9BACL|nr:metalloregulator ArsR/SmtB family transcription factor [Paenibacillus algorifonticola]SFE88592.1 DNA-binding transcriptional regulator, ArsR family [Paenibacillus algorifonticola]